MEELLEAARESSERRSGIASTIIFLGIVVLVIVVGIQLEHQSAGQPTAGAAPNFSLTTFQGQTFSLADQRGKVSIVNFWASWCIPCREEAPRLQSLWERCRERGVVILGIA